MKSAMMELFLLFIAATAVSVMGSENSDYSIKGIQSGPYKSTLIEARNCTIGGINKNSSFLFECELYNTTTETNLMRGKTTVLKDERVKKMQVKSFVWDQGKWRMNYVINTNCKRVFFPIAAMIAGLRYNAKTCQLRKGVYSFTNLNANKAQHMWMQTQNYARVMWRTEMFSNAGSEICVEFETVIEPDKK